jgi:lysophospholipase L1-like esterase
MKLKSGTLKIRSTRHSVGNERWFAVITVFLAIATSLAVSELVLRLFPPAWLRYRMESLALDGRVRTFRTDHGFRFQMKNGGFWRLEPNSQIVVSDNEFVYTAHIDEFGGRKVRQVEWADKSMPVLPFMGDSFTFGVGVSDEETFASVLSAEVQELRILNLGVPASALNDHRRTVALRHEELGRPKKYIFFFFLGNDFSDLLNSPFDVERSSGGVKHNTNNTNNIVVRNAILKQSYLVQLARTSLDQVVYNKPRSAAGFDAEPIFPIMNTVDDEYRSRAQTVLESTLDELARMHRELDFQSLIVAVPDRYQINEKLRKIDAPKYGYNDAILDPSRPNSLLKGSIITKGISFFDPTPCLRTAADPSALYYKIDIHFTAAGHRAFSHCLAPELKRFVRDAT